MILEQKRCVFDMFTDPRKLLRPAKVGFKPILANTPKV